LGKIRGKSTSSAQNSAGSGLLWSLIILTCAAVRPREAARSVARKLF